MLSVQRIQGTAQARLILDAQQQIGRTGARRLDLGIPDQLGGARIQPPRDRNAIDRGFAEPWAVELIRLVQIEALRMRRTATVRLYRLALSCRYTDRTSFFGFVGRTSVRHHGIGRHDKTENPNATGIPPSPFERG